MPERLATASRAAPAGARPPLGQDQHNFPASLSAQNPGFQRGSVCARGAAGSSSLSAGTSVIAKIPSALSCCGDGRPPNVNDNGREPARGSARASSRDETATGSLSRASVRERPAAGTRHLPRQETIARGHAAERFSTFCDRPGCYEARRPSSRDARPVTAATNAARRCGKCCDRERKWLSRKTPAGRFKRRLEYQARGDWHETDASGYQAIIPRSRWRRLGCGRRL